MYADLSDRSTSFAMPSSVDDKKVFKLYSKSSNLIKCLTIFEDTAPTFVMPNSSVSKMFYEMIMTDGRD